MTLLVRGECLCALLHDLRDLVVEVDRRGVVHLQRLALEQGLDDSVKVCAGSAAAAGAGRRHTGVGSLRRVGGTHSVKVDLVHVSRGDSERRVENVVREVERGNEGRGRLAELEAERVDLVVDRVNVGRGVEAILEEVGGVLLDGPGAVEAADLLERGNDAVGRVLRLGELDERVAELTDGVSQCREKGRSLTGTCSRSCAPWRR